MSLNMGIEEAHEMMRGLMASDEDMRIILRDVEGVDDLASYDPRELENKRIALAAVSVLVALHEGGIEPEFDEVAFIKGPAGLDYRLDFGRKVANIMGFDFNL